MARLEQCGPTTLAMIQFFPCPALLFPLPFPFSVSSLYLRSWIRQTAHRTLSCFVNDSLGDHFFLYFSRSLLLLFTLSLLLSSSPSPLPFFNFLKRPRSAPTISYTVRSAISRDTGPATEEHLAFAHAASALADVGAHPSTSATRTLRTTDTLPRTAARDRSLSSKSNRCLTSFWKRSPVPRAVSKATANTVREPSCAQRAQQRGKSGPVGRPARPRVPQNREHRDQSRGPSGNQHTNLTEGINRFRVRFMAETVDGQNLTCLRFTEAATSAPLRIVALQYAHD